MDLYFKAAAVFLAGSIFLTLILLIGTDIMRATNLFNRLAPNELFFDFDSTMVRHTVRVSNVQFRQFAISVQDTHTLFLDNGLIDLTVDDDTRFWNTELNLIFFRHSERETMALPLGVSFYREISYHHPESTPVLASVVENLYRERAALNGQAFNPAIIYPAVAGLPSLSFDEVISQYRRGVNVSGIPGTAYNQIEAFVRNAAANDRAIRVRRFVRPDGSVILFADWWED
jgi:hypothetical protein